MKQFKCDCGAVVYFDNTVCLACGKILGFAPDLRAIVALSAADDGGFTVAAAHGARYRQCQNYLEHDVCNWLVRADEQHELCLACRLNDVIPDLSLPANREKWARVEAAKRRLVFSLLQLSLPVIPKSENAEIGLAFDIMADAPGMHVFTGHDNGIITLNLAEADPLQREQTRLAMSERYRTLLGHMRHESGHYYWDRLIQGSEHLQKFRELFGDERRDYAEALKAHYESPVVDWANNFVSAYASSHPWEDWAETFAHYLHMVDTLETAEAFGVRLSKGPLSAEVDFELLLAQFVELTVVLNALNRSMGQNDAYPFAIVAQVKQKLAFVHEVISAPRAVRAAA